jgi:hypothetical protein
MVSEPDECDLIGAARVEEIDDRMLVKSSGLFDPEWYLATYPDLIGSGTDPLDHYMQLGASEGRSPGPNFDPPSYLAQKPDVPEAKLHPLLHYIRHSAKEGGKPRSFPEKREPGERAGREDTAARMEEDDDRKLVQSSGLFDPDWYLARYPDLVGSGIDPLDHYMQFGAPEGRSPGPNFYPPSYLAQKPDVPEAKLHPLLHYIRHSAKEGGKPRPFPEEREPGERAGQEDTAARVEENDDRKLVQSSGLFDPDWYLSGTDPLDHYMPFGAYEGQGQEDTAARVEENDDRKLVQSSRLFDPDWYLARYPDLVGSGTDPLDHYMRFGAYEGRSPGPDFDPPSYLAENPNVPEAKLNPLLHYIRHSAKEGGKPRPFRADPIDAGAVAIDVFNATSTGAVFLAGWIDDVLDPVISLAMSGSGHSTRRGWIRR